MAHQAQTGFAADVLARIFVQRLLPAVGVYAPGDAVEVARAMLAGGLNVLEITFRHPNAPESVAAIRKHVPEMFVGAGTLLNEAQLDVAMKMGAQFGVTPGFNPDVVRAANSRKLPFIPGVATPGELEQALALGCRAVKIFPAEDLGGPAYIKALSGPYAQTGMKVIPMGGVSPANLANYLALPMVGAAGGTWMVTEKDVAAKNWAAITAASREAVRLTRGQ